MGWAYIGKQCRLKRSLVSTTRRLVSIVRSAFSRTVASRYTNLNFWFVYLAGCLDNESDPVHAFRHEARWLHLGFRNGQSNLTTHINMISAIIFTRKAVPGSDNLETRPASSAYSISQIGCGSATVWWGYITLSPASLASPPPPALTHHIGTNHILHHICIDWC